LRRSTALLLFTALLSVPVALSAQRTLHWDRVDVEAHLDRLGTLHVSEIHTMVFTGDWNGGERTFDIRPRQQLSFLELAREVDGGWRRLREDRALDEVDEFAWIDGETLRWRSRYPSDPPFASTSLRYRLGYHLTGILMKRDDGYELAHDFLFPERVGAVDAFSLRLTLDPQWQTAVPLRDEYTAERVDAGRGYVLNLSLQYTGSGTPAVLDTSQRRDIVTAVWVLLGATLAGGLWVVVREHWHGRFAALPAVSGEEWLHEHVLRYPAEVVGAAWDRGVGAPEVVALIARLVQEGQLESHVNDPESMSLTLKVSRESLRGHERRLVDRLFFDGRTHTSTQAVTQHYRTRGFNPADDIRGDLEAAVRGVLPAGHQRPALTRIAPFAAFGVGAVLLIVGWTRRDITVTGVAFAAVGTVAAMVIAAVIGAQFRANIQWGYRHALWCLSAALLPAASVAFFLWRFAAPERVAVSAPLASAAVALTLAVVFTVFHMMRSGQSAAAIAFRKRLAAGRAFFVAELAKAQPALRDDWFPWLLAFGLGPQVDAWSTTYATENASASRRRSSSIDGISATSSSSAGSGFAGFTGGRSGGGGGGAAWASAASGIAAGVVAPSDGSGGGGGSSSGGGGGGGW
jgi:uncharacterized membrane protein YgcG